MNKYLQYGLLFFIAMGVIFSVLIALSLGLDVLDSIGVIHPNDFGVKVSTKIVLIVGLISTWLLKISPLYNWLFESNHYDVKYSNVVGQTGCTPEPSITEKLGIHDRMYLLTNILSIKNSSSEALKIEAEKRLSKLLDEYLPLAEESQVKIEKEIKLELDLTTQTTGNAEQVSKFVGASEWRIIGDKLVVFNTTKRFKLDILVSEELSTPLETWIPNGATVSLVHSGVSSEQEIEKEIQDKGLNAPRLTPDHIDSKIKAIRYMTGDKFDLAYCADDYNTCGSQLLTICILSLENGFTVTGESACASPENFDRIIGQKIAYENAREKLWMLEGYLLKEKLYKAELDKRL